MLFSYTNVEKEKKVNNKEHKAASNNFAIVSLLLTLNKFNILA